MSDELYQLRKAKDGTWEVFETATSQVVHKGDHQEATLVYRRLKRQAGFRGLTPPFFLNRITLKMKKAA